MPRKRDSKQTGGHSAPRRSAAAAAECAANGVLGLLLPPAAFLRTFTDGTYASFSRQRGEAAEGGHRAMALQVVYISL